METYLVTGGAGFIGSHIVEELIRRGKRVRVLDNFSTGKRENIAPFQKDLELVEGDLRNPDDCRKAVAGVTYILHQGAIPSVPRSVADPFLTNASNIDGSLNLLLAARDAKVKRLVFASSSAIYGDAPELPKRENMMPNPMTPYALQKLTPEYYNRMFFDLYKFETVSLRYFNVYGPRQDPKSDYAAVIPKFITRMLNGKQPTIFGSGKQSRDFTYVADIANANILAASAPDAAGEIINIACGTSFDLLKLVSTINEVLGTRLEPQFLPPAPGDIKDSVADVTKARNLLDFKPRFTFAEGLAKTIAWYKGT
jgi:UDP-glucose 4-epimerase